MFRTSGVIVARHQYSGDRPKHVATKIAQPKSSEFGFILASPTLPFRPTSAQTLRLSTVELQILRVALGALSPLFRDVALVLVLFSQGALGR